jgi:hypothetical protein
MDLRSYHPTASQIDTAKDLACRGLLCYQPFILSDDFETGAGYEFITGKEGAGLVYCPDPPSKYVSRPPVQRLLIDSAIKDDFTARNQSLRVLYESMVDLMDKHAGPISGMTMADIGCCAGYFPLAFAKRGAKRAVGYDLVDYGPTFKLLNAILQTKAEFVHQGYIPESQRIKGVDTFDVVISIAVLVHLSDPLQHLALLGSIATRAIFVWTLTSDVGDTDEETMTIKYRSVNRYYEHSKFPFCFDVTQISPGLLRKSLEMMGFSDIYELKNVPGGMPDGFFKSHRGYLGVRPDLSKNAGKPKEEEMGMADSIPRLIRAVADYNVVSLRGQFWGIPQALGPLDLTTVEVEKLPGVIAGVSPDEVVAKIRAIR